MSRKADIQALQNTQFDLLIIGGGVTGAGIALDAATRGLKVALVEKSDYASGTSSKSTKLIHGGLRYLKQFEISLVREVGRERAIVHDIAPHLVRPKKMLLPITQDGSFSKFTTGIALWVYDYLAGVKGQDKRKMLNKEETERKEPLLEKTKLKAGGYYAEYRTDDARLTLALLHTARDNGAICQNYVAAQKFIYDDNHIINGLIAIDNEKNQEFTIRAHHIVNATGPWVDELRELDNTAADDRLFLSKGIHIVLPHNRLPVQQALYFDVGDKRMIFAIPRLECTYIGTTDTEYVDDLDEIHILKEEVAYLLAATNKMFPSAQLTISDVQSSWAGLRPLIREKGKSAGEISRKDELFIANSGLINIAGGKLTGYRKMAEKVVDKVLQSSKGTFLPIQTEDLLLKGAPLHGEKGIKSLYESLNQKIKALKLPPITATYLLENYGTDASHILETITEFTPDNEVNLALIRAEAKYCIEKEQARTLLDFYSRRTGRLYFNIDSIEKSKDIILQDFACALDLDAFSQMQQIEALQAAVETATCFS